MSAKTLFDGGVSGKLFLDRRQFYITPQRVAELWPNVTPFTTLVQSLRVMPVQDTLYKMFEHRSGFIKQRLVVNDATPGTVPNNDTGVSGVGVDGLVGLGSIGDHVIGLQCEVWDSTETTKKGQVVITARSTNDLTLKSLKGATITLADNDVLEVIGNVRGEETTAPEAFSDELSVIFNSTQFFSTAVNISNKLKNAALRGYNSELARLRDEKSKEFKMQKENTFLKGSSVLGTNMDGAGTFSEASNRTDANGKLLRTTYGFISALEDYGDSTVTSDDQNIFSINRATYTWSQYVDDTEKLFDKFEGTQRFAFCGRGAMSYWSKMDGSNNLAGKSGWTVNLGETKMNNLGFAIRVLETPHGVLHLAPTKALRRQYNLTMAIPDHNHLFLAQYEQDEFKNDIKKDDDYDGVKDVFRADQGLGMELEEKHALITMS